MTTDLSHSLGVNQNICPQGAVQTVIGVLNGRFKVRLRILVFEGLHCQRRAEDFVLRQPGLIAPIHVRKNARRRKKPTVDRVRTSGVGSKLSDALLVAWVVGLPLPIARHDFGHAGQKFVRVPPATRHDQGLACHAVKAGVVQLLSCYVFCLKADVRARPRPGHHNGGADCAQLGRDLSMVLRRIRSLVAGALLSGAPDDGIVGGFCAGNVDFLHQGMPAQVGAHGAIAANDA